MKHRSMGIALFLLTLAAVMVLGGAADVVSPKAQPRPDGTFVVYGPLRVGRGKGDRTTKFTAEFEISPTETSPYTLHLVNGNGAGRNRVSSAMIWLNGDLVVQPHDFNQKVGQLQRAVELRSQNSLKVQIQSRSGSYLDLWFTATDVTPPDLTVDHPPEGWLTSGLQVQVEGSVHDETPVQVTVNGASVPVSASGSFSLIVPLATEGENLLTVQATDGGGLQSTVERAVIRDTTPPLIEVIEPADGTSTQEEIIAVVGAVTDASPATLAVNGVAVALDASGAFATDLPLVVGENVITLVATDAAGNSATETLRVTCQPAGGALPPDPSTVAPALDMTVATTIGAATAFLYTGDDPIQEAVAEGTIDPVRVAVIRGRVLDPAGDPLPGVSIEILDHPEYGHTLSRADGWYDLAVNGGGKLTVTYAREGYLSAQRPVEAPWQDYALVEDLVLVPLDPQVTVVDLAAPVAQVAQGTPQTDDDGMRQATLIFLPGTQAEMVLPDGSTQPLRTLSVRATEYTVGDLGPQRMPAPLPPTSGYTYAVELSADEALEAGATEVRFSQPLPFYVENFVGFPVGGIVPMGYYDRQEGKWIASPNGRVVAVLGVTSGLADLDLDGDGTPASPDDYAELGILDAEREQLAALYVPGTSLWRVPLTHMSPHDPNWPVDPPEDAEEGEEPEPEPEEDKDEEDCKSGGSIIECRSQVLGETIPLVGTPYRLHYRSSRTPGRRAAYLLEISLSSQLSGLSPNLTEIVVEVDVAGQRFQATYPPATGLTHTFEWNGRDAYGRLVQGEQPATVRVGYVWLGTYTDPAAVAQAFGRRSGTGAALPGTLPRPTVTFWQEWQTFLGTWNAAELGLGGWSLSPHHTYSMRPGILYQGDGEWRQGDVMSPYIEDFAGSHGWGYGGDGGPALEAKLEARRIDIGPDGSVYVAHSIFYTPETGYYYVRRVSPNGVITTFAGNGSSTYGGDGQPATAVGLHPSDIAVGPSGDVYIADGYNHRIYRIGADGMIHTVAGTGVLGTGTHPCYHYNLDTYSFEGSDTCPATEATLRYPNSIAVAPDGTLYFGGADKGQLYEVGTDGLLSIVIGCDPSQDQYGHCSSYKSGFAGDGGPARQARIRVLEAIAVGPDGSIYLNDDRNRRIRRISPDGIINTVAGTGNWGYNGDGGLATDADLKIHTGIDVGPDGTLYITEYGRVRMVRTDGRIYTLAGTGSSSGPSGDGGPALQATVGYPQGVAVGYAGDIYIAEGRRVRRILPLNPGFDGYAIQIASTNGQQLYQFDATGRHLRTLGALSGEAIHEFGYDRSGFLTQIEDRYGNVTTVERDAAGNPVAIVAPFGQRTELTLDADGLLETVTNPAGETIRLSYTPDGLLATKTDPLDNTHRYSYDEMGRLIRDEDPAGGFTALDRAKLQTGFEIRKSDALNEMGVCRMELAATGTVTKTRVTPSGQSNRAVLNPDGTWNRDSRHGGTTSYLLGPDPRWGMQSPLTAYFRSVTPSGLTYTRTHTRSVTLADDSDPLSLLTLTAVVDIGGRRHTSIYDRASQTLTFISPEGRQTVDEYQGGDLIRTTTPGLAPIEYRYDARGRRVQITHGSRQATMAYNAQSLLETYTDPLGHVATLVSDAAGRLISLTEADGRQTRYENDATGNLTAVIMPSGARHELAYNALGLLASYTPPDVGPPAVPQTYTYDLAKQLTRVDLPDGRFIDLSHDAFGRVDQVLFSLGTLQRAYDPLTGRLSKVTGPGGSSVTFEYDGILRTGRVFGGPVSGAVRETYGDDFLVASRSVEAGAAPTRLTIAFARDHDGLRVQAGDMTIIRDPLNGFITGTTLGKVTTEITYDQYGEVVRYEALFDGARIYVAEYARDAGRRIVTARTTTLGHTDDLAYAYDLADRLIEVRDGLSLLASYTYDANGNRTSVTDAVGTLNATYDAQDRLLSHGDLTYEHNATGQRIRQTHQPTGKVTDYVYDELGNLRSVQLPDGTLVEYLIDPTSRRVGRVVNGALTQGLLYKDLLNPVAELDPSGEVRSHFVYATRWHVPDYMVRDGRTLRIVADHLGSPRLVVDVQSGDILQALSYDAFGRVTLDTNPGYQPFGFAGGLYDPLTGLVRYGARDYDPDAGRWTAKDPVLFGTGPGTENLYTYALNNPATLVDPTGRSSLEHLGCGPRRPVIHEGEFAKQRGEPGYWLNEEGCLEFVSPVVAAETADGAVGWKVTVRARPGGGAEYRSYDVDLESTGPNKPTPEQVREAVEKFKKEIEDKERRERGTECGEEGQVDDCTTPESGPSECERDDPGKCGG